VVSTVRRLLLALLAVAGLCVLIVPAASADPVAQISDVQNLPGQVQFVYTVNGAPAGTVLDAKSIAVSVGGKALQATVQQATAQQLGRSVSRTAILVVDLSGSMAGSRLVAARAAAIRYVQALPADVRIGLITFADSPRTVMPPTTDRAAVLDQVRKMVAAGNTALYDAVQAGLKIVNNLSGQGQTRLLILSDGADTASKTSRAAAISGLRGTSASADVVALGSQADQPILSEFATAGRGQLLSARNATDITAAFGTAAQSFSQQVLVTATLPADLAGTNDKLDVALSAAGLSVRTTQPLSISGSVAPAPPALSAVRDLPASTGFVNLPLMLALTFGGILALCGIVLFAKGGSAPGNRQRLAELDRYRMGLSRQSGASAEQAVSSVAKTLLAQLDRLLRSRGTSSSIALDLDRAGLKLRPQEWVLLRISFGVVTVAAFFVLSGSLLAGLVLGVLIGWLGTKFFLKYKTAKRCRAFADQLPDTLQLVASSLRSGFSLLQALDAIVREGTEPAASEFSRAMSDGRLGVDIEDALENVSERMSCPDLSWVVMAIRISREVGGNLAEVLMTTVHTMRERAQVKRQVRALSAEGRLSGVILVGLPILIAAFLFLTRRAYLQPLYTDPLGLVMLGGAVVSMCIGAWWMSKIVKIEV
jgi:tight adherence protein B